MEWSRVYRSGKLDKYRAMADSVPSDVVVARMSEDPDPEVRCVAAVNQHVSAEVRDRLVADEDHRVRGLVASCWGTPSDVVPHLAADPHGGTGGGGEEPLGLTRGAGASGRGSRPWCAAGGWG